MINLKELDDKCIPLVVYFNLIGLPTQFSCEGHDNKTRNEFQIIFKESVTDGDIKRFLERISLGKDHTPLGGSFLKWSRKMDGKICNNWKYSVTISDYISNQYIAIADYHTFKEVERKILADFDERIESKVEADLDILCSPPSRELEEKDEYDFLSKVGTELYLKNINGGEK